MPSSSRTSLETLLTSIGEVVRHRREQVGLSQDELGRLCGLHRTYVGGVERGERNLTIGSLLALCGALQLSPHELLKRAGA